MMNIKPYYILIIALVTHILFTGCDGGSFLDLSMERDFWVIDMSKDYYNDSTAWYKIETRVREIGEKAIVYVDKNENRISDSETKWLIREFDNNIYSRVTNNFASPYDVDNNNKTIIVVLDIRDTFETDSTYVGGYFFSTDLFSKASVDNYNSSKGTYLKTNEGDILYIDYYPHFSLEENPATTVAHEFQHLVNRSNALRMNRYPSDTWIDEGFAEAANHLCYGEVTSRINFYNQNFTTPNEAVKGYIRDGHPLFYWYAYDDDNNDFSNRILVNYSLSYLFFQYLKYHSASGNGIFKKILQSSYYDYRSITAAMSSNSEFPDAEWGSDGEEKFKTLLLRWYATNAGVSDNDKYRYSDDITTIPEADLYTLQNVSLISGGGVVGNMTESFSPVEGDGYIYLSVDVGGLNEDLDPTDGLNLADYFVTVNYNYNTFYTDDGEPDGTPVEPTDIDNINTLPISSSISSKSRSVSDSSSSPEPYKPQKIDFILPPGIGKKLISNE